jgi:hypothetical protein
LLVLALVAVLLGIVAGNVGSFISGSNFEPPDRVLKKAVLDAVYHASESKQAAYLSYFEESTSFRITNASGEILEQYLVYQKIDEDLREEESLIPKVIFQAIGPLSGEDGDRTDYNDDELELSRVSFHSGSSTPFSAEIEFRGETEKLVFDPFSGYVLKNKE